MKEKTKDTKDKNTKNVNTLGTIDNIYIQENLQNWGIGPSSRIRIECQLANHNWKGPKIDPVLVPKTGLGVSTKVILTHKLPLFE